MSITPTLQQHLATLPALSADQKDAFAQQLGRDMGQLSPADQLANLHLIRQQIEQVLTDLRQA